jgi:hypothetical protein
VPAILSTLTLLVNLLSLCGTLWLGLYIVTRSSSSLRGWLAALALWFLACFFVRNILLLYYSGDPLLFRVRLVGMLGLTFWFHLILLLLPPRGGWLRLVLTHSVARRLILGMAYGLGLLLIIDQFFAPVPELDPGLLPVTILGRASRFSNPLVPVYVVAIGVVAYAVLSQTRTRSEDLWLRRFVTALSAITVPAIAAGLYLTVGPWLYPALPAVPADAVLGVCVILLGYNVARYDALVEGRTIDRDALYSLIGTATALGLYLAVILLLHWAGQASFLTVLLLLVCVILSHTVYDGGRTALDRLFYHGQYRHLRANLRSLAREAGTGQALSDQLSATLTALCRALHVDHALVALQEAQAFTVYASERSRPVGQSIPHEALAGMEIVTLPRPEGGWTEPGVLVPLWAARVQIGAVVLGPKPGAQAYSDAELELLDDLAERIATLLHAWRLQQANAGTLNQMVADFRQRERALQREVQQILAERDRPIAGTVSEDDFTSLVEECLRRLDDFSFLGQHALANLHIVSVRVNGHARQVVTHMDRGKALHAVLLQALDKLKPAGREPGGQWSPAREWHQFIILFDGYVLRRLTREIMLQLNISEPTFHRTRRRAVRSLAKTLREMEEGALLLAPDSN